MLNIEMLSTGDEVLHGQIIDTNAAWLADYCFTQGLPLTRRTTCGDQQTQLVNIIKEISLRADVLIVNGGLGPTSDDLTAQALAEAMQVTLVENDHWLQVMEQFFQQRGRIMESTNRKQAWLPQGTTLIDNPVGTACGFFGQLNQCLVFCTPGVPHEFNVMVTEQILPYLRQQLTIPAPPLCLRMTTLGCSESQLAKQFDPIRLPAGVVLGYRSAMPIIELKLTGPAAQQQAMQAIWQQMQAEIAVSIIAQGTTSVGQQLADQLQRQQRTLAVVDGCTAGLLTWQWQQAAVPVRQASTVYQGANQPSLAQWLTAQSTMAANCDADYLLVISQPLADNHFHLLIVDQQLQQRTAIAVQFLTQQSSATYQQIMALYASSLLIRYLTGVSLNWQHGWVNTLQQITEPS